MLTSESSVLDLDSRLLTQAYVINAFIASEIIQGMVPNQWRWGQSPFHLLFSRFPTNQKLTLLFLSLRLLYVCDHHARVSRSGRLDPVLVADQGVPSRARTTPGPRRGCRAKGQRGLNRQEVLLRHGRECSANQSLDGCWDAVLMRPCHLPVFASQLVGLFLVAASLALILITLGLAGQSGSVEGWKDPGTVSLFSRFATHSFSPA